MESRRIWKFELKVTDQQFVSMPKDPEILSVQYQGQQLCVWAMVEPENVKKPYRFLIFGTGSPLPNEHWGTYLATVQDPHRPLVWHVFHGT